MTYSWVKIVSDSTAENEPSTLHEIEPGCLSDFVKPEAEMDLDM